MQTKTPMSSAGEVAPTRQDRRTRVCYLCGLPLGGDIGSDHVPPRQFYAKKFRKNLNMSSLLTVKVHRRCNEDFGKDEEYFVRALVVHARRSLAGRAKYEEILAEYRKGKNKPLMNQILREFDSMPGGILLPRGSVLQKWDKGRVTRVAWKIVRGLLFHHRQIIMPEQYSVEWTITLPDRPPPTHFQKFREVPRGSVTAPYPAAFDYRFDNFSCLSSASIHYWALLLWDQVLITSVFHDQACRCTRCCGR